MHGMWDQLASMVIYAGSILTIYMLGVFCFALWKQDNSVVDRAYGLGFVVVTGILYSGWDHPYVRQSILFTLVTLWGLRLSLRNWWKGRGKSEDFRYRSWREAWTKRSMLYFFFRSLLQIYFLQGSIILVVLLPILISFSQMVAVPLSAINYLGLGLWFVGFVFEVVGDAELDAFLKRPENAGKIMTTGLWKYTRHPNYFGEASMWWGIWLFVLGIPLASYAVLSPILITFLLVRVSGIPMLEARWAGRSDWEVYRQRTSVFFPWFPKKDI